MNAIKLRRRGFNLGSVPSSDYSENSQLAEFDLIDAWKRGNALKLGSMASGMISEQISAIRNSEHLYHSLIASMELDASLSKEPYATRLASRFEALGSAFNEGNNQEIETVFFDGLDGRSIVAEDLWIKVSWLSFYEQDKSLRLRFSFGVDFEEDVAKDKVRQQYSAELAELIFQESTVVTSNQKLIQLLQKTLKAESIKFVERIVYFNAPNGGAYLHHDRERGHSGVVYAQLTGKTFWLAIPRAQLAGEIVQFINHRKQGLKQWPSSISLEMQQELLALAINQNNLICELESFSNDSLIHLINETEEFIHSLVTHGYGEYIVPGDILVLPQENEELCCWHSVFCAGEETGQALSFAIRAD